MKSNTCLTRTACLFGLALLVIACAKQYEQNAQQIEQQPINCATAPNDIATLQSEKADVAKKLAMGVSAVFPLGLVTGAVTGTERTKVQVATGEYNQMIDQKIAQIRATCGL
jgi:hypothetical protein